MSTFLLVHGAFQGGWAWKKTAGRLNKSGHETHTPTLTGCGYLSNGIKQDVGLHNYIQDVSNYLFFHDLQDVILVAHSYSGMVCAAAAMRFPHLIRKLVFADAVIPESNTSFADMGGETFKHMLDSHRTGNAKIKPWPLPGFGVPEEKASWFAPRLRDFPEAAFTTAFPGEFEPDAVPAAFITCTQTQNPMIRKMADKAAGFGWPVTSLDSDHNPMTTHPEELAELLHGLAE